MKEGMIVLDIEDKKNNNYNFTKKNFIYINSERYLQDSSNNTTLTSNEFINICKFNIKISHFIK